MSLRVNIILLLVTLPMGMSFGQPATVLGEVNEVHAAGAVSAFVSLASEAFVVDVVTPPLSSEERIGLLLSGPSTFVYLKADDFQYPLLWGSALEAGEYHLYVAGPPRAFSLAIILRNVSGVVEIPLVPAVATSIPLREETHLEGTIHQAQTGTLNLPVRGVLGVFTRVDLTGPGFSSEWLRHRVASASGSDCRVFGGGLLGSANIPILSDVRFHYGDVTLFVADASTWTLESNHVSVGLWAGRDVKAYGMAVSLSASDALQAGLSRFPVAPPFGWEDLYGPVPPSLTEAGRSVVCVLSAAA